MNNFQFSIFNFSRRLRDPAEAGQSIFNFKIFKQKIGHWSLVIGYSHRRNVEGFTLIEVLVAATIIGILSTIGATGFQAVTRNGRDALRKSDLEQLRSALEIYKSEYASYPVNASACIANLSSSYVNPYPSDPRPSQYRYCYIQNTALTYTLCAHLENGTAGDFASDCGGANNCTGTCNYKVNNP